MPEERPVRLFISPSGSVICFDYMTAPLPSTYTAESFQFWIETERIEVFLAERGHTIVDHLTPEDIKKQYLTLRDGSSAGELLPFFCFLQASVKS